MTMRGSLMQEILTMATLVRLGLIKDFLNIINLPEKWSRPAGPLMLPL